MVPAFDSHISKLSNIAARDGRGPDPPAQPDHHGGGEHGKALQLERAEQEEAGRGRGEPAAQVP